jgi:hypothetical protein
MQTVDVDIQAIFKRLTGQRAWRIQLGVGSFLTFEFGRRVKEDRHFRGEWHLWIYQACWALSLDGRTLAAWDSKRGIIKAAIQRLESSPFTGVEFDSRNMITDFSFANYRLVVSPADYLSDADERDEYWLLFMPDDHVLTVGPGGVNVRPANS